jgi:hypothetical protein
MMAVDSGPGRMIFAGLVLSSYEFAKEGVTRLTDEQWKPQALTNLPPTPEWISLFIVPGRITVPDYARQGIGPALSLPHDARGEARGSSEDMVHPSRNTGSDRISAAVHGGALAGNSAPGTP